MSEQGDQCGSIRAIKNECVKAFCLLNCRRDLYDPRYLSNLYLSGPQEQRCLVDESIFRPSMVQGH
jgi:hypothetical protein